MYEVYIIISAHYTMLNDFDKIHQKAFKLVDTLSCGYTYVQGRPVQVALVRVESGNAYGNPYIIRTCDPTGRFFVESIVTISIAVHRSF